MKRRIIFATGNKDKMKEIRQILADLGMEIISMKEAGVDIDIVEDGMSFEENAEIKARSVSRVLTNDIVLADDSGLEIDYLDKAPGIYSARFAGEDTSYDVKNRIFLDRLEGVPDEERTARFVCADANDEALDEADVIITDPPRKGCGESLIRRISSCKAKRVVYISCNPDTLARDCRLFEEFGYRYGKVYLFDLFPRTGHVEAVVCLEKSEVQG